jgi:hypothetical protein
MEKVSVTPTKKSKNPLLKDIKVRNKTSSDVILVMETSPNAMIVRSADLRLGQFGGGGGIEREKATVIQNQIVIPASGEYVATVDGVVYISIFRKVTENRYEVICLNHRMEKRDRCELTSLNCIDEVTCIETMQKFREPVPSAENSPVAAERKPAANKTVTRATAKANAREAEREIQDVEQENEEDLIPGFQEMAISFPQAVLNAISKTSKNGKPRRDVVDTEVQALFRRYNYVCTPEIDAYLKGLSKTDFTKLPGQFAIWHLD